MSQTRKSFFLSSLAKKYFMGLTGLFLCFFLIGHLSGNLQLLVGGYAGKLAFNEYAVFMTTFPAVKILSYLTYFSIIFHAIDGIFLTIANRKARPVNYAYSKPSANSSFSSRNMGALGFLMLVFIVMHMFQFWAGYHFRDAMPVMTTDVVSGDDAGFLLKDGTVVYGGEQRKQEIYLDGKLQGPAMKDMHGEVMGAFQVPWLVAAYLIGLIAIALHLYHGFASGFQSLGLNHPVYTPIIKILGFLFAIGVPVAFAAIPLAIFVGWIH